MRECGVEGGVEQRGERGKRGCQRRVARQIENKSEGARHQPWARRAADFMLLACSYRGIARGVGGGEHSHGADEEEDEFGHDAAERGKGDGSNGVEKREGTVGRGWGG